MSKFTLAGLGCWLGGLLLLGFQSISTLMHVEGEWKRISLMDVVDEKYLGWTEGISWEWVGQTADAILNMPLFILLFCLGLLFFIINAFIE